MKDGTNDGAVLQLSSRRGPVRCRCIRLDKVRRSSYTSMLDWYHATPSSLPAWWAVWCCRYQKASTACCHSAGAAICRHMASLILRAAAVSGVLTGTQTPHASATTCQGTLSPDIHKALKRTLWLSMCGPGAWIQRSTSSECRKSFTTHCSCPLCSAATVHSAGRTCAQTKLQAA